MTTAVVNPLPLVFVHDVPTPIASLNPSGNPVAAAVVSRTVTLRADSKRLQADLERELRALLAFAGRRID
jgi:hypothetical protein